MAYLLALFAIGMLILVHEAGHYFVARWSGMRVERFSIGFGPAILKWQKAGTQFQIAPIFFGGFVHITGMNPHEDYDEKDPGVYPNRPTILRFLTILAGPATNMLFAFVLIFAVLSIAGDQRPAGRTVVVDVVQDSASTGRLQADDMILAVNAVPIEFIAFRERIQQSHGAPVVLTVRRGAGVQTVAVTPRFSRPEGGWLLGVAIRAERLDRTDLGLGRAALLSLHYPIIKSQQILAGLWDVATGRVPADAVGPVGITKLIGVEIRAGWIRTFEFLAMLNVYLCLVNLLPLPALDGARLVFLGYELATRRRPNPKVEAAVHVAGAVVLFIVMLLVTVKDIRNWFS